MITKWETEKERTLRLMNISPQKKMEWLYKMQQFVDRFSSKRFRGVRKKLKERAH